MRQSKYSFATKKMLSGERPNEKAGILHFILTQDTKRICPWIDDSGLLAGLAWEAEIYRQILASDVLLVLIGPGTSESPWVRREIALATALGIALVPLGFDLDRSEMDRELKALDIAHLQGKITQNIKLNSIEPLLSELRADLDNAFRRTKEQQKESLRGLLERRNPPSPKAADNQCAAKFAVSADGVSIPLYIATGDVSKVRDIDVLVNSENDYMQMARFYESRTVSCMLRRRGARRRDGKYEDTIQQELDWQLRDRGRPVQSAEVFVTSAGSPESELVRINKARYIFHVSAVESVDAECTVVPFKQPFQIESCVRNTLSKLAAHNRCQGIISPPGTEQRNMQERLAAEGHGIARSIIFPLFGTGQGGSPATAVIGPMIEGLTGFFKDEGDHQLSTIMSRIYISIFKQQDFEDVTSFLHGALS